MRKITSLILLVLTSISYSQMNTYTFSQGSSTYSEIGGITLGDETTVNRLFVDPTVPLGYPMPNLSGAVPGITQGPGFPIGFTFKFNGINYDRFGVASDGWIGLGTSTLNPAVDITSAAGYKNPLSSIQAVAQDVLSARISAFANTGNSIMAQTGASLQYQTIGTAPNRSLVIQWKNYRRVSATGESFNFQIWLNEGTNTINFNYGNFTENTATGVGYQVGLRSGPSMSLLANYINRTSTAGWDNTSAGLSSTDLVMMENSTSVPSNGLIFTWTPPICGVASAFSATNITTTSANLYWSPLTTAPLGGYEYIVSTSSTAPLPSDSGIATTNTSVALSGINPDTTYYVYFRSNCGSDYTQWAILGKFKTLCPEVTTITENFDTTPAVVGYQVPDCWSTITTAVYGVCYVAGGSGTPGSAPNLLQFYASQNSVPPTATYLISPLLSNLQSGTYRIRFKATASAASAANTPIDIGYLTDITNPSTFVNLKSFTLPNGNYSAFTEFQYIPTNVPTGIKNLVFRNSGINGTSWIYMDDVFWELAPLCSDITNLKASITTADGKVNLSWTASSATNETQYVYSTLPSANPDTLTPNSVTTSSVVLNLNPGTSYTVWVRSKCTTSGIFGNWIATSFTTPCTPVQSIIQNFDSSTNLPTCWNKVGQQGGVLVNSDFIATTPSNLLVVHANSMTDRGLVRLPALSNTASGTQRLRFNCNVTGFGPGADGKLEIGYLTDANDGGSFVSLQQIGMSATTALQANVITLGSVPTTPFLAFRATGSTATNIKIDDVVWEPIPTCSDITGLSATLITNNSTTIGWNSLGGNTTYQYAFGSSNLVDPSSLTPVDISTNSITISQLNPSTTYKAWVRSVCHGTDNGAWIGPLMLKTNCNPVDSFSENFDSSTLLPTCWSSPNTPSMIYVTNTTASASAPNELVLSSSATENATIAMPTLSPSPLGTRRLKFKFKAGAQNATVEVGYLPVLSDPSSFVVIKTYNYSTPSTTNWVSIVDSFAITSQNQVLAFRNKGTVSTAIYLDDVVWELTPSCPDVSNIVNGGVTNNTLDLAWSEGGQESAWQYALGASTVTDPTTLTPVDVTTSSIQVSNLSGSTTYKIWVRSKCDNVSLGTWIGPLTFTTTCDPVSYFYQNFDSSNNIPSCWIKSGNGGTIQISNNTNASTLPNSLFLYSGSQTSQAIIEMPLLNNADKGTNRLRFKSKSSTLGAKLEVGYMANATDPTSFVSLQTFTTGTISSFENKIAELGNTPMSQILAFRNGGSPASTIYIDDVYWEPIPTCQDVTSIMVTSVSSNNAVLNWNSGQSFQYVIGGSSVSDPGTLTPIDLTNNTVTIGSLNAGTLYNVWLRSKCSSTSFGVWVGPITFTTNCTPITDFSENFDASTNIPTCWNRVGNLGGVYVNNTSDAPSPTNTLVVFSDTNSGQGLVAMPAVSNSNDGTHRLSFKAKSNFANSTLQVGYVTNLSDPDSFVSLQVVTIFSSTVYNDYFVDFRNKQVQSQNLAFRNVGADGTYIYLDNVVWKAIPSCGDVVNPHINIVKSTMASIGWNQDITNNNWQYALGQPSDTDPNTLALIDVNNYSITINNLIPSTDYRIWIRSKCTATNLGDWVGPIAFETTCPPVATFTEKFDASTSLPACWKICGTKGSVSINTIGTNSNEINSLNVFSGTASNQAVVAMPPVNNAAANINKLKFKAKASVKNAVVEIGYLNDITDPNSFVSLQSKPIGSTTSFTDYMIDLGTTPQSEVLAFRNAGNVSSNIYIDDVIWDQSVLGTQEFDSVNFLFYPNPVKNTLNISYNQNIDSVSIFNLLGQEIISKNISTDNTTIDMSDLSYGTYLVRVTSQNQVTNFKVIKE